MTQARDFTGKVALISGAARGIGLAAAEVLAQAGATVIGFDTAHPAETVLYPTTQPDLVAEADAALKKMTQRSRIVEGDVRDQSFIDSLVAQVMSEHGRLDIVVPNAGICSMGRLWELTDDQWSDMIDINLTGVWRTLRSALPAMIEAGNGGSVVAVSSIAGLLAHANMSHYGATKHGVNSLVKSLANEVAAYGIRVNSVNPTNVGTPMILNEATFSYFSPGEKRPTAETSKAGFSQYHLLDTPWVEPIDVANAIAWLCSVEARYLTGVLLPVDAGTVVKWP